MPLIVLQDESYAPLQQGAHALHQALPGAGHDLGPRQGERERNRDESLVVETAAITAGYEGPRVVEERLQLLREVQLLLRQRRSAAAAGGGGIGCVP